MLSEPLPYHQKIRDYFKSRVPSFYSASRNKEEQQSFYKTDLLKNTSPFQPDSNPLLYEKIHIAKEKLGLGHLSVTAYQATDSSELNAGIVCLRNEAHLVFTEGLIQLLDEEGLLALITHELAHIKLYALLDGDLEITDRIITVLANSPDCEAAHYETARLFRLYSAIYCDREAYRALGDAGPVITMLHSALLTHPENIIRTRALRLWQEQEGRPGEEPSETVLTQMIEGARELDRLDVLGQQELKDLTRRLLVHYLRPGWFQTPAVVALAKQYFPTTQEAGDATGEEVEAVPEKLHSFLAAAHESIREYFAYLLLDFALADPDLEDVPLGYALQLAGAIGLTEVFEPIVKKELTFTDKQWERQRTEKLAAYNTVNER